MRPPIRVALLSLLAFFLALALPGVATAQRGPDHPAQCAQGGDDDDGGSGGTDLAGDGGVVQPDGDFSGASGDDDGGGAGGGAAGFAAGGGSGDEGGHGGGGLAGGQGGSGLEGGGDGGCPQGPAPVSHPRPRRLPKTGPTDVVGLAASAFLIGGGLLIGGADLAARRRVRPDLSA